MESSDTELVDTDEDNLLPFGEAGIDDSFGISDDFDQTLAMVEMDIEEVLLEIEDSHEEVSINIV